MKIKKNIRHSKRGAALVEYGLIVAGVALVAAAAVSVFGSKTAGLVAASARVLPGANADDNGIVDVGHIVSVTNDAGVIGINTDQDTLNQDVATKLGIQGTDMINDPNH